MNKFDVATYNIWCPNYPSNPVIIHTEDRYTKIADRLKQFHVLALQEITQKAFDQIGAALSNHWRAFVQHPNRPDGVAIFMNKDMFFLPQVTEIEIPEGDNKCALLLTALHKTSNKTIAVASGHFKGGPLPGREKGDTECLAVGAALDQVDADVKILAGDFNEVVDLNNPKNRITRVREKHQFQVDTIGAVYHTEPAKNRTIDHILFKIKENSANVSVTTREPLIPESFERLSDHFPFAREFSLNVLQALAEPMAPPQPLFELEDQLPPQPLAKPVVPPQVQPQALARPAAQLPPQPQPQPLAKPVVPPQVQPQALARPVAQLPPLRPVRPSNVPIFAPFVHWINSFLKKSVSYFEWISSCFRGACWKIFKTRL